MVLYNWATMQIKYARQDYTFADVLMFCKICTHYYFMLIWNHYFWWQKLGDSVIVLTRQDKEKVLFHNNKDLLEETDESKKWSGYTMIIVLV